MSIVFRAACRGRELRCCASSLGFYKLNVNATLWSNSIGKSKALTCLATPARRRYGTEASVKSSAIKGTENNAKETGTEKKVEELEVIYIGLLYKNIRRLKLFSIFTSVFGLSMQPYVYTTAVTNGTLTAYTLPVFAVVAMFALATPPLLHMITKKYIIKVEYDEKNDKYIATSYNLFAMQKRTEFTPDDVTVPTVLGMFTSCAIKGKPYFMDSKYFSDQNHYIRIMGYDKPLDLKVDTIVNKHVSKKDTD